MCRIARMASGSTLPDRYKTHAFQGVLDALKPFSGANENANPMLPITYCFNGRVNANQRAFLAIPEAANCWYGRPRPQLNCHQSRWPGDPLG